MLFTKPPSAGLGVRVTAFVFDYFLIAGYLIFVVAVGSIVNALFPIIAYELFGNPLSGQITGFLIITLPVSLYFLLFESSTWQATWGKRRLGLRVARTDGTRLTVFACWQPYFAQIHPVETRAHLHLADKFCSRSCKTDDHSGVCISVDSGRSEHR